MDKGGFWPPVQISRIGKPIYKIQRTFDGFEFFRGKPVVDIKITDDVTGQIRVKMFDDLSYLALLRITTVSI